MGIEQNLNCHPERSGGSLRNSTFQSSGSQAKGGMYDSTDYVLETNRYTKIKTHNNRFI